MWNYLTSPAFYQLQQAKQAQEAELAQPVAAAPPAVATAPPFLFPSAVASPVAAPAAPAAAAVPAAAAAPAKVMRVEKKKKGSGFASVFAVTAAESVTIDLSPTRNPTDVISEIEQLFLTYISEGLDTITQMKAAAQPINFNIYTNQFGSTASMTDNVSMLEGIRANIIRYISDQFHPSSAYEPLLFVVMDMVTKFFPGPIGPGDPVSTLNLLPGESVEKRMKTSETDTTKRAQTNSVVDSNSQTAKQNLKNTIQNTQNQSHDVTSDTNKYTSAKETTTSHNTNNTTGLGAAGTGMGGQAQGAAGGIGGVMQSVGGIMSMIPGVGGILGGIVNVVGGLIGGAGSSGGSGGSSSGVGGEIGSAVRGVVNTLQNVGVIKGGPKSNLTDIASKDATTEKNETDKLT
ncbi:MAG TPA: hypothetical protein VKK79_00755, partial [Candidatus Lokiarchaeia archaeon]|nr:hypothetical protein [Candidatus Lokiarchaeia archaeon]